MRLFKSKPRPPLEEARRHIEQALEVAFSYKRDKRYLPTNADLVLFGLLAEGAREYDAALSYIHHCMKQRFGGEPEGSKKFTDPEVFDYHYPP